MAMQITQVAAQLYTVRDHVKTLPDFAASMRKVRAIGYRAVQVSGVGPIAEDEIVRVCAGEGLTICATHEGPSAILDAPAQVAARLAKLGCRHTAVPSPGGAKLETLEDVKAFAGRLDAAGRALAEAGVTLSYHNHQIEFRRVAGRPVLEHIYALTDARHLKGEPDTYWVQAGGGDPVEWCRRLRGRLPLLHMKDFMIQADNTATYAEIGNGNLNWPAIVAEAERSGCEWFIVEQDKCPGDPFDSLRQSFEFIRDNLCQA